MTNKNFREGDDGVTEAKCFSCKEWMPFTKDLFVTKRNSLERICKVCNRKKVKAWKQANKEKVAAQYKRWMDKNPGYAKDYYHNVLKKKPKA